MPLHITLECGKHTGPVAEHLARLGIGMTPIEHWEGIERWGLSPRTVVQHFTGPALIDAIIDKSLFVHATELADTHERIIFILSGETPRERALHPNALRGAISALPIQYAVTLLSVEHEVEAARMIHQMAEHEQLGVPEISLHPKRKAIDLPDMQRRVAEMLPGCGITVARRLLRQFGTLAAAASATESELTDVSGIGKQKAREIHAVLCGPYLDIDWERDIEEAIARHPRLLFAEPIEIVARQHVFFTEAREKLIPDLIAIDAERAAVYIVELKRSRPTPADVAQLRAYLDNASASDLLRGFIEDAWKLRGILASPQAPLCVSDDADLTIVTLSREAILRQMANG